MPLICSVSKTLPWNVPLRCGDHTDLSMAVSTFWPLGRLDSTTAEVFLGRTSSFRSADMVTSYKCLMAVVVPSAALFAGLELSMASRVETHAESKATSAEDR